MTRGLAALCDTWYQTRDNLCLAMIYDCWQDDGSNEVDSYCWDCWDSWCNSCIVLNAIWMHRDQKSNSSL